jgi:hypothetical protein
MAEAPEVVVGNGIEVSEDKPQLNASSTDVSKAKYSIDGLEEGEAGNDIYTQANPPRPGFTKFDQKDMWRMGRIQEFKVRERHYVLCQTQLTIHSEIIVPFLR